MNEIINAYENYIKFLEEECNSIFSLAYVRGYRCSPEKAELGEQYRRKISDLKNR